MKRQFLFCIWIILFLLCPGLSAFFVEFLNGIASRVNAEEIYSNDNEEVTVSIDEEQQGKLIKSAQDKCALEKFNSTTNSSNFCRIDWDTIMCWPDTKLNHTVYLPCANYINKFNMKKKAHKTCKVSPLTGKPIWSLTNFTSCLEPSEEFVENMQETKIIERHMRPLTTIRTIGYVASLFSLTLSIIILLRPKLRCSRNYIHINLFIAFMVRTILAIAISSIVNSESYSMRKELQNEAKTSAKNLTDSVEEIFFDQIEESNIGCKTLQSAYRYTQSVYHVAIFAEALYLVLLLKFPYYNEKRGCWFFVLITWTVPVIWMTPWILVKLFHHDIWCWQTESFWNIIIKVPHTLIYVANFVFAVIIIRILYSKMQNRTLSFEKIIKYRRLAKSILILIPVFGLHFVLFSWIPYANQFNLNPTIEMISAYGETFFTAFQGLVVSITCCFIQREVRIECLLFACELLKKLNCHNSIKCMECIDSDYIRQLRYKYRESRSASFSISGLNNSVASRRPTKPSVCDEKIPMLEMGVDKKKRTKSLNSLTNIPLANERKASAPANLPLPQTVGTNQNKKNRLCCCLFGNQKNDFYQTPKKGNRPSLQTVSSKLGLLAEAKIDNLKFKSDENLNEERKTKRLNNFDGGKKVRLQINGEDAMNESSEYDLDDLSNKHSSIILDNNSKHLCELCGKLKIESKTTTSSVLTNQTCSINNESIVEICDCLSKKLPYLDIPK